MWRNQTFSTGTRSLLPPICCNCKEEHFPTAPSCPLLIKQRQIHILASVENIPVLEARAKLGITDPMRPSDNFNQRDFLSLSLRQPFSNNSFPFSPHSSSLFNSLSPFVDSNPYSLLSSSSDFYDSRLSPSRSFASAFRSSPKFSHSSHNNSNPFFSVNILLFLKLKIPRALAVMFEIQTCAWDPGISIDLCIIIFPLPPMVLLLMKGIFFSFWILSF